MDAGTHKTSCKEGMRNALCDECGTGIGVGMGMGMVTGMDMGTIV